MTEFKKPNFDVNVQGVCIVQDAKLSEPMHWGDVSFAVGQSISVKYSDMHIDLIVTKILSDTEAIGRIRGFENHALEYEGLSQGEEVAFKRKHVCGISR